MKDYDMAYIYHQGRINWQEKHGLENECHNSPGWWSDKNKKYKRRKIDEA